MEMYNRSSLHFEMKSDPKSANSVDIYIYDNVGERWKDTDTNISTAKAFRNALEAAGDVKKLNLHVNSCGGACDDGVAIYSMIRNHSAEKTAYIDGYACSIASLIIAACDKVVMSVPSAMQIHNALTFAYGNARNLRAAADALDKITSGIKAAYLERAGRKLSVEKLDKLMDGKDGDGTWLTASECIQYGLCDEIIGKTSEPDDSMHELDNGSLELPDDKTKIMNTFRAFIL